MTDIDISEALAPGLDLFAATWMHQWAEAGGSVQVDRDGKAWLGFPLYHDSPAYTEPSADLPEDVRNNQEAFSAAHYHGTMRGMLDLIEAMPGGHQALKHHMRVHGMVCYFGRVGAGSCARAIAPASILPALIRPEEAGFSCSGLRVFSTVPDHDDYDVVALRGKVIVMDRALIGREGILEGSLYIRENQQAVSCMPWELWLRRELADEFVDRRCQPVSPLKTRREVVQAIRWPKGDYWGARLAGGGVSGPYHDSDFGRDLIGKVVGIYRPVELARNPPKKEHST